MEQKISGTYRAKCHPSFGPRRQQLDSLSDVRFDFRRLISKTSWIITSWTLFSWSRQFYWWLLQYLSVYSPLRQSVVLVLRPSPQSLCLFCFSSCCEILTTPTSLTFLKWMEMSDIETLITVFLIFPHLKRFPVVPSGIVSALVVKALLCLRCCLLFASKEKSTSPWNRLSVSIYSPPLFSASLMPKTRGFQFLVAETTI